MDVSGKTRAACKDVGTKIQRLLDTLSVMRKSADEIGKLRDKYSGGGDDYSC